MSKGIGPNDLVLNSTLQRLDDYKASLSEVIRINLKLERAVIKLAGAKKGSTAQFLKAQAEVLRIEKLKKNAVRKANIEAKKNTNITKRNTKGLIRYKQTLLEVNRATKTTEASLRQLNSTSKKSSGIFSYMSNKAGIVIKAFAGLFIIDSVAGAITNAFNKLKKLDSLNFTLQTLLKNEDDIARTQSFLLDISNKYGAELVTLTERYIKFLAAAKQSNIAMKDTEKIYKSVVKAAGVMGLSQHELEGALLAIEQMMSKGKVTTEELRRQLGERMPGAFGIMAAAVNRLNPDIEVTVAVLDKMLRKGEVLASEVLPLFAEELEKAYGITGVENVQTLIAEQTRLTNAWTEFVRAVENGEGRVSKVLMKIFEILRVNVEFFTPWSAVTEANKTIEESYKITLKQVKIGVKSLVRAQAEVNNQIVTPQLIREETDNQANAWLTIVEKELIDYQKILDEALAAEKKASDEYDKLPWFGKGGEQHSAVDKAEAKVLEAYKNLNKARGRERALKEIIDGIWKDDEKINNLNNDGGNKNKRQPKAKKIGSFNKKDLQQYNTLLLIGKENQLKLLKSELGLSLSYKDRRDTLEKILILEQDIAKVKAEDAKKKLTSNYEKEKTRVDDEIIKINNTVADNKQKGLDTDGAKERLAELSKYKISLEEKYIHDKLVLETKLAIKLRGLEAYNSKAKIENLRKAFNDTSKSDSIFNVNENNSLSELAIAYKNDEINYKTYEERKTEIANHYSKLRKQNAITILEDLLKQQQALGDHEGVDATTQAIAKLNKEINEIGIKDPNSKIDKLNDFLDQFQSAFTSMIDGIANLTDALYERNISDLEDRLDGLEEFYDRQYELAEGDAEQQRLVREEEKIAKDKLNKEIAAEKTKQAKAAKEFAIFNAAINTAGAIIGFLANPSGPAGVALSVLAGITGAAQIAAISARPIPKYKHGRRGGIAEYAYVGDGYKHEYVKDSSGVWETPNVPTLTYLEAGASVYKDKTDFIKNGQDNFTKSTTGITTQLQYKSSSSMLSSDGIKDEIKKGFENVEITVYNKIVSNNNNYTNQI